MEIMNGTNLTVPDYGTNMTGAVSGKAGRMPADREAAAANKVAKEFETMFVGMMLKSMRETVGKDKLTNGGHGEEVYRSMLDQEYAKSLTEHGGVGLTAMLERQLGKPATGGAWNQGIKNYDTSNQSTKTEVTYENR
jgi:flagellar protein FlgJ